jgi:hypothetical protein
LTDWCHVYPNRHIDIPILQAMSDGHFLFAKLTSFIWVRAIRKRYPFSFP